MATDGATNPNQHLIGKTGGRGELATPALVLDLDRLEANIARMAAHCTATGQKLRPHAKTHKSVTIARRQLDAGAVGICCATIHEAEALAAGGIEGILITSPLTTPAKLDRLSRLLASGANVMVAVDNADNVDGVAAAAERAGRTLDVLVDLDLGLHRTGAANGQTAVAVARRVEAAPALRYRGVQAYAGDIQHIPAFIDRHRAAMERIDILHGFCQALSGAGLAPEIVSGGGTGTHDIDHEGGLFNELQAGSYVFMDVQYAIETAIARDGGQPFAPSLTVQAAVVSTGHEGFCTTDAGLKAFSTDGPVPTILSGAPEGATYRFMGDEHGRVTFAKAGESLPLGARVECFIPHCDPTVNLHDAYHVCRGDTLVDIWPVDGRGSL
ncbi:MAG: threonine aldolase [Rhodospirillaceae bacterium]|nr:threonine aldolase [Rhodospirillaceae bacterium]